MTNTRPKMFDEDRKPPLGKGISFRTTKLKRNLILKKCQLELIDEKPHTHSQFWKAVRREKTSFPHPPYIYFPFSFFRCGFSFRFHIAFASTILYFVSSFRCAERASNSVRKNVFPFGLPLCSAYIMCFIRLSVVYIVEEWVERNIFWENAWKWSQLCDPI